MRQGIAFFGGERIIKCYLMNLNNGYNLKTKTCSSIIYIQNHITNGGCHGSIKKY